LGPIRAYALKSLDDGKEGKTEEGKRAPADKLDLLVDDCALGSAAQLHSQIEKSAHAMTAAPAGSPWAVKMAYPTAVDSRNMNARKTNNLVQIPAFSTSALTPKAWKREMTIKTMVPVD
jgi:hypothetical protein